MCNILKSLLPQVIQPNSYLLKDYSFMQNCLRDMIIRQEIEDREIEDGERKREIWIGLDLHLTVGMIGGAKTINIFNILKTDEDERMQPLCVAVVCVFSC